MTEDFDTALRSILGQLIEAREDQNDADKRLQDYRAANTPPEIPNEFEDVDAFLDYHHRRQSYENYLRQHENALKKAKKEYADAAEQLLLFLPEGVPLRYTYEGERSELFSTEYVIVRKQGEIVIQSPSRAPSAQSQVTSWGMDR
ncbi:MAG: hypothetical protein M3441_26720 [Chloroflexota bacterium]|nr:hypothetical protein [Chloroflexota bacterium]